MYRESWIKLWKIEGNFIVQILGGTLVCGVKIRLIKDIIISTMY